MGGGPHLSLSRLYHDKLKLPRRSFPTAVDLGIGGTGVGTAERFGRPRRVFCHAAKDFFFLFQVFCVDESAIS